MKRKFCPRLTSHSQFSSFVGTIVLLIVENTGKAQQAGLLISYYIVLSFWAAQTLAMSMISRNTAGQTKKTVIVAANFVAWAVGNAIGPQVFLAWDGPRYRIAFCTHMGCYVLLVIVIVFLRWWLVRENKRKDRIVEQNGTAAKDDHLVHAFEDLTDVEVSLAVLLSSSELLAGLKLTFLLHRTSTSGTSTKMYIQIKSGKGGECDDTNMIFYAGTKSIFFNRSL